MKNQLTLEMAIAVSMQAFLGLLTIELTFKSRSSSAIFWDCHVSTKENQIQIKALGEHTHDIYIYIDLDSLPV